MKTRMSLAFSARGGMYWLAISWVALVLAACGGTAPAADPIPEPTDMPPTTLTLSGSGSVAEVVRSLADAYSEEHADLAFDFLSGSGSGGGVRGVVAGDLDLGLMARAPTEDEAALGITYLEVARDKIVVVTSSDLTIPPLTNQQVNDIFFGTITNWSEVGGSDMPINVFVRDEEDSATLVLRDQLFGDAPFPEQAVVLTSSNDMRDILTETTASIGYLKYTTVVLNDLAVRPLIIDGHDPADTQDDYPFTSPIGVVYLPDNREKVQPFIEYLASDEVNDLLNSNGEH